MSEKKNTLVCLVSDLMSSNEQNGGHGHETDNICEKLIYGKSQLFVVNILGPVKTVMVL